MSAPLVRREDLEVLWQSLDGEARRQIEHAVERWAAIKENGGRVVVATGSGPNLHEGATTQIAELVRLGLVDGVLTSSAVVGHEMAGALERVRRVEGALLGLPPNLLPADGRVEVALLGAEELAELARHTVIDHDLYRRMLAAPGHEVIKVAGNLAYPTGLCTERAAHRLLSLAKACGLPLEVVAGLGADPLTMLGACARREIPCLVTVPQLVGGGQVGLALGDSIPVSRRSAAVARLLASADLIVESGLALAQEIHDGPFELYTGHGMWARHEGQFTFSLGGKDVVRIDLDPAIGRAWRMQHEHETVSRAIDLGLPKACETGLAFRMEMSGFARLPKSRVINADLGLVWPVLTDRLCRAVGVKPEFMCYKQGMPPGEAVRSFIVDNIRPLDVSLAVQGLGDKSQ